MIVTPEIVLVAFRRRIGRSLRFWLRVKAAINSELEGTWSRWYLAAVRVFSNVTSACVGFCRRIKSSIIVCVAISEFDVSIQD